MYVAYGINYTLFDQLRIGKVRLVSRPLGWYMKGLHWIPFWIMMLTALFWRTESLWR